MRLRRINKIYFCGRAFCALCLAGGISIFPVAAQSSVKEAIVPDKEAAGDKAKAVPSGPKVEAKTRSRKIAKEIQKAVVEGDVDEVENGLIKKEPAVPVADKAGESLVSPVVPAGDDGLVPVDENEDENIYVPVEPSSNGAMEGDGRGSQPVKPLDGNEPDADVLKNPLLLPELTRKKTTEPYRSVSTSRQFFAMGEDNLLCSSITSLCETVKTDFLALLKEKDAWKYNITVKLVGKAGDPVVTNPFSSGIEIIGGMPFFEITVQIGQGLDMSVLRTYLTEMLIYERSMRRLSLTDFPEDTIAPAWLVAGMNEAMLWKNDTADRKMYAALFERGEILTMDELFKVKNPVLELDASSYGVYRASCGALVCSLLNQGGGEEAFKKMLDQSIFTSVDGQTLLKQNFPAMNISKNSLYKWWALQLSSMAVQPMTESMTVLETEEKLEQYSHVLYYDEERKTAIMLGPEDYKRIMALPASARNALLQPAIVNLTQLSYRAFPYQRDLVVETMSLIERIIKDKLPGDMDARLEKLQQNRKSMLKVGTRTRDYLDWYTIVNSTHTSGSFNSYLKTMSLLRDKKEKTETPISKYLDDMEKLVSPAYETIDD